MNILDKFADELKSARQENGLTIQQVAAKSRIDLKFIEAMENGNFSFLPDIYVKAFIKDYANIVGLDPAVTLKKLEAAKAGKIFDEPALKEKISTVETAAEVKTEEKTEPEKPIEPLKTTSSFNSILDDKQSAKNNSEPSNKNLMMGIFIAAVIIIAALIYLIFFKTSDEIIVNENPSREMIDGNNQNRDRYIEETPLVNSDSIQSDSLASSTIGATSDSLSLNIKAADTSWVKILIDDKIEEEFILFPKSQKNITAGKNFKITFGKAKVVQLQLDDKSLSFKPQTDVAYILVDKNGIQYLNKSQLLKNN